MRPVLARRATRPKRLLASSGASSTRSFFCVDLRAVENHFQQKTLEELRQQGRGSRLGALLSTLDLDPRYPLQKNLHRWPQNRAFAVFEALCEEMADTVLFDVPQTAWRPLLALLLPGGVAEAPYPKELMRETADEKSEGMLLLLEDRFAAESAQNALLPSMLPAEATDLDAQLWADVRQAVLPMLEAVRDKGRALLVER